jgi:hypothetical protein
MPAFVDLSAELLIIVASHLSQVDLLNVSLTSKSLRSVIESELYRECYNSHLHSRSIKPHVLRLLHRPDLARNVRNMITESSSDMNAWQCFIGIPHQQLFPGTSPLTAFEYEQVTQASINHGLITDSMPWEELTTSLRTIRRSGFVRPSSDLEALAEERSDAYSKFTRWSVRFHEHNFQYNTDDNRFCKMLCLGFKEPWLQLLFKVVPNVRNLDILQTPSRTHTLPLRTLPWQ